MARELIEIEEARSLVLEGVAAARRRGGRGRRRARPGARRGRRPASTRCRASTTRRWTASRSAPPTRPAPARDRRCGCGSSDESRAGHPAAQALGAGEAIAISTGAMLPDGADCGGPGRGGQPPRTAIWSPRRASSRAATSAAPARTSSRATIVIAAGTAIGPAELGVLVSVGRGRSAAPAGRPGSLVSTGDELLEPADELTPGGVRNSNAWALAALAGDGGSRGDLARTVPATTRAATREAVGEALKADVAVICGGVSVGEHDHVRPALAALGVEQVFWGVALRPGKPTWFGTARRRRERASSSACPATRSPRWSPSCSSCGPRSGRCSGEDPAATARPPCSTPTTRSGPAAPTRSAAGWSWATTAGTPTPTGRAGLARAHLDARRRRAGGDPGRAGVRRRRRDRSRSSCCPGVTRSARNLRSHARLRATVRDPARARGRDRARARAARGRDRRRGDGRPARAARPGRAAASACRVRDGGQPRVRRSRDHAARRATSWRWSRRSAAARTPRSHARVTDEPLSLEDVAARVGRDRARARSSSSMGITREVERLDYEAYAEMADRADRGDPARVRRRHGLEAAAAEHRTGSVPLGEPSVIVAVSAGAPRRGVRRRPRGDRPDQGRGADLEGARSRAARRGSRERRSRGRRRVTPTSSASPTSTSPAAPAWSTSAPSPRPSAAPAPRRGCGCRPRPRAAVARGDAPKGDVIGTARLAGIAAAKRTGELIPLAHPLPLTFVDVEVDVDAGEGLVVHHLRGAGRRRAPASRWRR